MNFHLEDLPLDSVQLFSRWAYCVAKPIVVTNMKMNKEYDDDDDDHHAMMNCPLQTRDALLGNQLILG